MAVSLKFWRAVFCCLLFITDQIFSETVLPKCPIVELKLGKVKGITTIAKHDKAKPVFNYNAIPFGKPPTGERRFKEPEPYTGKWEGVLDGTLPKNGPLNIGWIRDTVQIAAPQDLSTPFTQSEDCLNVNVYTPSVNESSNLAVMVWFYGGGFDIGSNQDFDGTALSGLNDVVIVIPNYRVGVFGFLSFGPSSSCPGNAGLLDQVLALKWVKENIRKFGGNPDSVTIFGQSAGGVSVGHHTNSPMSQGLFHRAIEQSGSELLLIVWETGSSKKNKQRLLEALNITDTDESTQLRKLQSIDSEVLLEASGNLIKMGIEFSPVVDGRFIVKKPTRSLKDKKIKKVATMIGYNDGEGMGLLGNLYPGYFSGLDNNLLKLYLTPSLTLWKAKGDLDVLLNKVIRYYTSKYNLTEDDPMRHSKIFGGFYGQFYFDYPAVYQALKQADQGPVYTYFNNFKLKMSHDPAYSDGYPLKPSWSTCDHGEDMYVTFGAPFLHYKLPGNARFTAKEEAFTLEFMKYLTNFAKYGNPNNGQSMSSEWLPYDATSYNTMKFTLNQSEMFKNDPTQLFNFYGRETINRIFNRN